MSCCIICGDKTLLNSASNDVDLETIPLFMHRILNIPLSECVKLLKQNEDGDLYSSFCEPCSNLLINGQRHFKEINDLCGQIDGIRFRLLNKLLNLNDSRGEKNNPNRHLLVNKIWSGLKIPVDKRTETVTQNNDGMKHKSSCVICERKCKIAMNNGKKLSQILHNILKIPPSPEDESFDYCRLCSNLLNQGQDFFNRIFILEAEMNGIQFQLLDRILNDSKIRLEFGQQMSQMNRYFLHQMIKCGLKLQVQETMVELDDDDEEDDDVEMETVELMNDQSENCDDGIGIITKTESMSTSSICGSSVSSSTNLNLGPQDEQHATERDDELEIKFGIQEDESFIEDDQNQEQTKEQQVVEKDDEYEVKFVTQEDPSYVEDDQNQDQHKEQQVVEKDDEFEIKFGIQEQNLDMLIENELIESINTETDDDDDSNKIRLEEKQTELEQKIEQDDERNDLIETNDFDSRSNDSETTGERERDQHITSVHTGDKSFPCKICPSKFSTADNLRAHKLVHTDDRLHGCNLCSKHFKRHHHLRSHVKLVHNKRTKEFSCKECNKAYFTKSSLTQHQRIMHKNNGERLPECYFCHKKFSRPGSLVNHMRTHTEEQPFVCPKKYCKYSSAYLGNLNKHKRLYHSSTSNQENGRIWTCYFCFKTVRQFNNLNLHLRHHTKEVPFKCNSCNKTFINPQSFARHITNQKPFSCSQCSKSFKTNLELKQHMVSHTKEKRYFCEFCSYGSYFKAEFNKHLLRHQNNTSK